MQVDFSRLEQLASKLNQSSEALNESAKLLESKFSELRLGVEAHVPIDQSQLDLASGTGTYFSYCKRKGRWGLFFTHDYQGEEVASETFAQASRELRLKALTKIPELISRLEKGAVILLDQVHASQHGVDSVLAKK